MNEGSMIQRISVHWTEIEKIFKCFREDVKSENVLTAAEFQFIQSQFQTMLKQGRAALDEALKAVIPTSRKGADKNVIQNQFEIVQGFVHASRQFEKRYILLKQRRTKLIDDISEVQRLFNVKKKSDEKDNHDHNTVDSSAPRRRTGTGSAATVA